MVVAGVLAATDLTAWRVAAASDRSTLIEVKRGEHRSLVSLDNLTEEEIERLC